MYMNYSIVQKSKPVKFELKIPSYLVLDFEVFSVQISQLQYKIWRRGSLVLLNHDQFC